MQQLLFFLNTKQILVIPQKYQSSGGAYTISQYLHCPLVPMQREEIGKEKSNTMTILLTLK